MSVTKAPTASWPLQLPADLSPERVSEISARVDELADSAQYGWGHTIDFGPFAKRGLMGLGFLRIAGALDSWGWWPTDLTGKRVADIGCFTGGLSMYLAARGPSVLYAVDELDDHLEQCRYMSDVFGFDTVQTVNASLYQLDQQVTPGSLDLILLSGVLYHLSDMLVGLYKMRELLTPGGVLIVETNAVDDTEHSYANFGRYFKGMWWQPSALCIKDMCEFMGFTEVEVRFYVDGRALVRCVRGAQDIPFKRGMNWDFESRRDAYSRTEDESVMAPVPHPPAAPVSAVQRPPAKATAPKSKSKSKSSQLRRIARSARRRLTGLAARSAGQRGRTRR